MCVCPIIIPRRTICEVPRYYPGPGAQSLRAELAPHCQKGRFDAFAERGAERKGAPDAR